MFSVTHIAVNRNSYPWTYYQKSYFYLTRQIRYKQMIIYNDGLPWPNPDNVGPIVRRPIGLPITAESDTAFIKRQEIRTSE